MPQKRDTPALSIEFPLGGLDKGRSYQRQEPYTTPHCSNVWPRGASEGRARGGSRPAVARRTGQSAALTVGRPTFLTEFSYIPTDDTTRIRRLLAGTADGRLWREHSGGSFVLVTNETADEDLLNTSQAEMWTAELLQKVYVADTGPGGPYVYDPTIDVDDGSANTTGNPLFPWGSSTVVSKSGTAPTTTDIAGRMTFALSGPFGTRVCTTTITTSTNLENAGVAVGDKLFITVDPSTAANLARQDAEDALKDAFEDGEIQTWKPPYYGPKLSMPVTISGKVSAVTGSVVQVATDLGISETVYQILVAGHRWDVTLHVFVAGTTPANVTTVTKGNIPQGNYLIARWRERIILAGAPSHMWYMSRQGDPDDFDFGQPYDDPGRAVAGISEQDAAGSIGDDLTAVIPFGDENVLFGAKNSMWVMRGDPAAGGSIFSLSNTVGVLGQGTWCHGPAGEVVFLSRNGLYLLAAGPSSVPQPLSRQTLPQELVGIDLSLVRIRMVYDIENQGVHIFLTRIGVSQTQYFMDWDSKTFWPVTMGHPSLEPIVAHRFSAEGSDDEKVVMIGSDGFARMFDASRRTDQGLSSTEYDVNSYVTLGPFQPGGGPFRDGILQQMDASPDIDGDGNPSTMTWEIFAGETHEQVIENVVAAALPDNGGGVLPDDSDDTITVDSNVSASGMWDDGMNLRERPRVRGVSLLIRLASKGRWAFEVLSIVFKRTGRQRAS